MGAVSICNVLFMFYTAVMFIKTIRSDNGRGILLNTDHIDTIEPATRGVLVTFENGESVETQADFHKLENLLGVIVVPDGAFPD